MAVAYQALGQRQFFTDLQRLEKSNQLKKEAESLNPAKYKELFAKANEIDKSVGVEYLQRISFANDNYPIGSRYGLSLETIASQTELLYDVRFSAMREKTPLVCL